MTPVLYLLQRKSGDTPSFCDVDGHPTGDVRKARMFASWNRCDQYRRVALAEFADVYAVRPLSDVLPVRTPLSGEV